MANEEFWSDLEERLTQISVARQSGRFVPILEADMSGYLYFLFVQQREGDASKWHLDTRVLGAAANDKFDLVHGDVLDSSRRQAAIVSQLGDSLSEEHRRMVASKVFAALLRPAVQPTLILEVKFFAPGFTPQQNREHFRHAIEDIQRLKTLRTLYPDCRAMILVDCLSYTNGHRCDQLLTAAEDDDTLRLYLCDFLLTPGWRRLAPRPNLALHQTAAVLDVSGRG